MVGRRLGRMAGKLARTVKPITEKARATDFAHTLLTAYEAGKRGEESAPTEVTPADTTPAETTAADADEVADALGGVDWTKVRAAAADRTAEMSRVMKTMAADVDWARVQAGAARVSSALIAAVASGQLPIGGRLAGPVARAIINDHGLAQQVSDKISRGPDSQPPDFRGIIETTGRDAG